ncbi:MAG: DUF4340 domain-containing protein [Kiritimatiellae bacterium]|nr:DUF4340 domain-containing protein [Kiritimatiellia bacterium]
MNIKTTLWLLLVCAGLWWVIQLSERHRQHRRETMQSMERFLDVTAEAITMFSITSGDLMIECERIDDRWMIQRPLQARADGATVDRLLSALESLSGNERILPEQRVTRDLALTDYGLEDPALRIVLKHKLGQKILFVGDAAPLGNLLYVQVLGDEDVVVVPDSFTNAIPGGVPMLRDRSLLHGDAAKIMRLEIDSNVSGFLQITRTDDAWMLQQPVAARANEVQVSRVLDALFDLEVQRFVWDAEAEVAEPNAQDNIPELSSLTSVEPYGLGEGEAVRVSVWLGADGGRQDLLLGKQSAESEDHIYAKLGDAPSVYTVPKGIVDAVCLSMQTFRDPRIFSMIPEGVSFVSVMNNDRRFSLAHDEDAAWFIVEPLHVKAEVQVVEYFVRDVLQWEVSLFPSVQPTNMAVAGLHPPICTVEIGKQREDETRVKEDPDVETVDASISTVVTDPATRLLRIGAVVEQGGSSYRYAAMGDSDEIFFVASTLAADPRLSPSNVLHFRDRTVLTIPPEEVMRVSLSIGEREQCVVRMADGDWAAQDEEALPIIESINDILLLCANLRVSNIAAVSAVDVETFGFDQPSAALTLGLTGDAGIQKTILFGRRANKAGVTAMVKGQDVRFTVPLEMMTLFTRNLIAPKPKSEVN